MLYHNWPLTKKHISYRNCNLTRLLKESLGGNSLTTMIICLSPTLREESLRSLEFGQRAKVLKNKVLVNKELSAETWKLKYEKAKEKMHTFKNCLLDVKHEVQRWRKGDSVPIKDWINLSVLIDPDSSCDTSILNNSECDVSTLSVLNLETSENEQLTSVDSLKVQLQETGENALLKTFGNLYAQLQETSKNDELMKAVDSLNVQLQEQANVIEKDKVILGKVVSELNKVKDELAEKMQKLLLAGERELELSTNLEREKEMVKNFCEDVKCGKCVIRDLEQDLGEVVSEILLAGERELDLSTNLEREKEKVKNLQEDVKCGKYVIQDLECEMKKLDSLLKMTEGSERNFEKMSSELKSVQVKLAEKSQQLSLAFEKESKLLVSLQAEKDKVQNLQEVLESKNFKHRCEMRAQINDNIRLREQLDSSLKAGEKNPWKWKYKLVKINCQRWEDQANKLKESCSEYKNKIVTLERKLGLEIELKEKLKVLNEEKEQLEKEMKLHIKALEEKNSILDEEKKEERERNFEIIEELTLVKEKLAEKIQQAGEKNPWKWKYKLVKMNCQRWEDQANKLKELCSEYKDKINTLEGKLGLEIELTEKLKVLNEEKEQLEKEMKLHIKALEKENSILDEEAEELSNYYQNLRKQFSEEKCALLGQIEDLRENIKQCEKENKFLKYNLEKFQRKFVENSVNDKETGNYLNK